MVLPLYLALTAAEISRISPLPELCAYMACHFSPYTEGISNIPDALPFGAVLILNDRIPCDHHSPDLVAGQLAAAVERLGCESVLLDFERPPEVESCAIVRAILQALPCPVAVTESFAQDLSCPVFLAPAPLHMPLAAHLAPWQGREIWLEAALEGITLTLTEAGCSVDALHDFPEDGLAEDPLHCHYTVGTTAESAIFRLWRTRADLENLLKEAEARNITKAIGLWQELGR